MLKRYSASYNAFNGQELLIPSLKRARKIYDHISIVYQIVSNQGKLISPRMLRVLLEARVRGLADELYLYHPSCSVRASENELAKRMIGLQLAIKAGCLYYATIDCDEFWIPDQVNLLKKFFESHMEYDVITAPTYLHVKSPVYRSRYPDTTRVILWTRISGDKIIEAVNLDSFSNIDPTCRLAPAGCSNNRVYEASVGEVAMYHMNLVRLDGLRSKLANTTSADQKQFISDVQAAYKAWNFGKQLLFPGKPPIDIQQVEDIFGLLPKLKLPM